jgi:hypothetical protein
MGVEAVDGDLIGARGAGNGQPRFDYRVVDAPCRLAQIVQERSSQQATRGAASSSFHG